jgi:hypothetical protein
MMMHACSWGGPEYTQHEAFDLRTMLTCGDGDGLELLRSALMLCPNLVFIIPRNTTASAIKAIARSLSSPCCIDEIYMHSRIKLKVAYFGDILTKGYQL